MKFTQYFLAMRQRSDRAAIKTEWIQRVVEHPAKEVVQQDGRVRRWAPITEMSKLFRNVPLLTRERMSPSLLVAPITEMDGRHLRVILLADGETVHNAFFDRSFKP